ncbi:MAG: hypothetical protein M0Z75_03935 [Nitrospiraceae bacterium]|nr:hypothetical protein [Nitrospiraceae bacterium]
MPKKGRTLPQPPGRKGAVPEGQGGEGLIFDGLQEAMAGGEKTLEEFMKKNIPEGEYARRLTGMAMGMSGIQIPAEKKGPSRKRKKGVSEAPPQAEPPGPEAAQVKMPEDILRAAREGDVRMLSSLLAREREKSSGVSKETALPEEAEGKQSLMEKEIMDSLYEIAVDNGLQMDWIIQRALRLYIRKYHETGQL